MFRQALFMRSLWLEKSDNGNNECTHATQTIKIRVKQRIHTCYVNSYDMYVSMSNTKFVM